MIKLILTPRKQKILNEVIKYYLEYGEPVGSKLIAGVVGVSSATVRNEMADLTEQGFLEQPHTSAGRIPSSRGFRAHIKNEENTSLLDPEVKLYFDSMLSSFDPEQLLNKASEALSYKYACMVSTPGDENSLIKTIQFVQISRRTAMLILLSSAGTTKSRIFRCEFDLNQEMLRVFFRAFNERLMGFSLKYITPAFIQSFAASLGELSALMTSAIIAFYEAVQETAKAGVIINGQTNLFVDSSINGETLLALAKLIQSPDVFRNALMERPTKISVILGGDSIFPQMTDASIVSAKYHINNKEAGVFAVIGSRRMDYPKIISEVKYVSDCVSAALNDFIKE